MKFAWTCQFLQHMLDGGYFSYGYGEDDHVQTGHAVPALIEHFFVDLDTRLLFPSESPPPLVDPHWFEKHHRPPLCEGGVTVNNMIRNSRKEQESFGKDAFRLLLRNSKQLFDSPLSEEFNFVKAQACQVPNIGSISLGQVLQISAADREMFVVLTGIICCEKGNKELPRNRSESIALLQEMIKEKEAELLQLTKDITDLRERIRRVAAEKQNYQSRVDAIMREHQVAWLPRVILQGQCVTKCASRSQFTADKIFCKDESVVNDVLFDPLHVKLCFVAEEKGKNDGTGESMVWRVRKYY